ncbi:MAG: hypothetical protein HGA45_37815, partial [Chloroflexales bacterium]|nr:hypothetical protein [Chloroflexales bacterium]
MQHDEDDLSQSAAPQLTLRALRQGELLRPAPHAPPLTLALLTDRRLAALVAGYVQRHGLAYAVRFLSWRRGDIAAEVALFDIVSADVVRPVPGFVCDFLRRLPRTALLIDALAPADLEHEPPQRVLVAWGRRPSLPLPHIQELLPAEGILVLGAAPWGAGLIASPPPRRSMHEMATVEIGDLARATPSAQSADQLQLSIQLVRSGQA